MDLRPFRIALIFVSAAALAACEGTVGTVDDPVTTTPPATTASGASTSGAGGDTVSGAQTGAGAEDATTTTAIADPRHPLDDPSTPLGTHTIYFEFDSSDVPDSAQPVIEAHARYLSEHAGASVTLEGHADERGSREYNIALGEKRTLAVRRLMSLLGATGPQIRTISYGEERPAQAGFDESAWRLNRRVEIVYRTRE